MCVNQLTIVWDGAGYIYIYIYIIWTKFEIKTRTFCHGKMYVKMSFAKITAIWPGLNAPPPCVTYIRRWIRSPLIRWWHVTSSVLSQYMNQCWPIINWTLRSKPKKSNQNTKLYIHKHVFASVVGEITSGGYVLSYTLYIAIQWLFIDFGWKPERS